MARAMWACAKRRCAPTRGRSAVPVLTGPYRGAKGCAGRACIADADGTGLYGEPMSTNGAPIRLVVPVEYGSCRSSRCDGST